MKLLRTVALWLLVCSLPLVLITTSIRLEISQLRLYEYGFEKYGISRAVGIDALELREVAQHLIEYFNLRAESPQITVAGDGKRFDLFNERELIHLEDVRQLIQKGYWVQRAAALALVCAVVLLLWLQQGRMILRGLFLGSAGTLLLMVTAALWAYIGFEQFFLLFHLVSFSNQYWMLDPARDYLIRLFPEGFFYDAAMFGFLAIIAEALVIGTAALGLLRSESAARSATAN